MSRLPSEAEQSDTRSVIEKIHSILAKNDDKSLQEWDDFVMKILPEPPNNPCFTRNDWVSPSFDVDTFIEKRKNISLETLRTLLSSYLSQVQKISTEILKQDFMDLIHMINSVDALTNSLKRILNPLQSVQNEITDVHNHMAQLLQEIQSKHERLLQINRIKRDLEQLIELNQLVKEHEASIDKLNRGGCKFSELTRERLVFERSLIEAKFNLVSEQSKLYLHLKERFRDLHLPINDCTS